MKFLVLLFIAFTAFPILPQGGYSVKGSVTDKLSGKALENANVFISNTTIGISADKSGKFRLNGIPFGSLELTASYLGYKTEFVRITVYRDTSLTINFELAPSDVKIGEVRIKAEIPEDWHNNFRIFRKEFIGETEFAEHTKILNAEVIEFYKDTETNKLSARSDSTIIIENASLGYRLFLLINNISIDLDTRKYAYSYSTRFEELKPKSEAELNFWKTNRKTCYLNSMKHFFKAMYNNRIEQEGFTVYSGRLHNLLEGRGMWTSPREFILQYNNDSATAEFTFAKCISVIKRHISILDFNNERIKIDKYGNLLKPENLHLYKWWAALRIADLLPFDYQSE